MKARPLAAFLSSVVFSCVKGGKLQCCVWETETHKASQNARDTLYFKKNISFVQDAQLFQEEGWAHVPNIVKL